MFDLDRAAFSCRLGDAAAARARRHLRRVWAGAALRRLRGGRRGRPRAAAVEGLHLWLRVAGGRLRRGRGAVPAIDPGEPGEDAAARAAAALRRHGRRAPAHGRWRVYAVLDRAHAAAGGRGHVRAEARATLLHLLLIKPRTYWSSLTRRRTSTTSPDEARLQELLGEIAISQRGAERDASTHLYALRDGLATREYALAFPRTSRTDHQAAAERIEAALRRAPRRERRPRAAVAMHRL